MQMAIENGKRCLEIPEGVKSISEDAAAVYNIGSIVSNISYILDHRELQRIEWEKKLRQRRLIKMTFPKEAGATCIGTVSVSGGKGVACTSCENASSGQSGICICGCISEVS